MQQKEWTIIDNMIQPMEMRPPSFLCIDIMQSIERLGFEEVYIRGSVTEECIPHPKSDVDIIAFLDRNPYRNIRTEIQEALRPFTRPCDVLVTSREAYMQNRALSLLGCTRSLSVSGGDTLLQPVPADMELAKALWTQYNPSRYKDGYPPERALITAKQLFRAIGVIRLIEDNRLSRHLPTCLQWAHEIAPSHVAETYDEMWFNLKRRTWQSVPVEPVVEWLIQKAHTHNLQPNQ